MAPTADSGDTVGKRPATTAEFASMHGAEDNCNRWRAYLQAEKPAATLPLRMKRRSGDRPHLVAARRQPFRHLAGVLADAHQFGREVQTMNQNAHWLTGGSRPGSAGSRSSSFWSSGREQKSA